MRFAALSLLFLAGCGVGTDKMLFTTNTTIGLDVDSKPPTTSIAYSRQEMVIAPQFEGGHACEHAAPAATPLGGRGPCCATGDQTPSVLATIRNEFLGFTSRQSFLTGHAADLMSYGILKDESLDRNSIGRSYLSSKGTVSPGERKQPFFFGTNTTLGVDFRYNPASGLPDALTLGFKRKELAFLPLMEIQAKEDVVVVEVPSVFAGAATSVDLAGGKDAGNMQVFATGRSAEFLAASKSMRASLIEPALLGGELTKVRDEQDKEKKERAEQKRTGLQVLGRYSLLTAQPEKDRMRARAKALNLAQADDELSFKKAMLLDLIEKEKPLRSEMMKLLLSEFP